MDKLKVKHDHKLTDIVKVCIFSLFLLLPLIIFTPSALYYGFNEHAKVPEETNVIYNYKYDTNQVNSYTDIYADKVYNYESVNLYITEDFYPCTYIILKYDDIEVYDLDNSTILNIEFLSYNSNNNNYLKVNIFDTYCEVYFTNYEAYSSIKYENFDIAFNNVELLIPNNNFNNSINFLIDNGIDLPQQSNFNTLESVTVETDETPTISTKMYKSWQDVWTQPVFNWTGNTNFAATINAMNLVFGISEESYITNYLTYVLTLTAVYIIFDIVLTLFTKLTHMFNS